MKQELQQLGTTEFNDLASACFGGKPKQERSYSEEEVLPIIEYIQWIIKKIDAENTHEEIIRLLLFNRDKIEQFKKK